MAAQSFLPLLKMALDTRSDIMKILKVMMVASAAFFIAHSALGQNAGTVTNHAFVVGKGAGQTGFTSLLCGSAQLAVGQAAADPICRTITGDVTLSASGVTAIGTAKVTNSMLATMASNTVKGNATGSIAAPTDISLPSCSNANSALTWTANSGFGCNAIVGTPASVNTVTANYTVATTDCENVIQAGTGTSGLFTVTLPAVTGFPTTCLITVKNNDTGRGKVLSGFPSSLGTTILWPQQQIQVRVVSGAWTVVSNPGRWQVTGAATLNVNHASGTDTNNDCLGTGAGACATIANAIAIVQKQLDCRNGLNPTIQNAAETFTENVVFLGPACPGSPGINFTGDISTPSNVVWQTSSTAMNVRDGAVAIVKGFKFVGTGSGNFGLTTAQFGIADFGNVEFGVFTNGYNVSCTQLGSMGVNAPYTVSGNMGTGAHMLLSTACQINCIGQVVTMPNGITFAQWINANQGATVQTSCTYTGAGTGGLSGSSKYSASTNATIQLNGTTLPGLNAGTATTGAQVF
jgi:hypothetical protein